MYPTQNFAVTKGNPRTEDTALPAGQFPTHGEPIRTGASSA